MWTTWEQEEKEKNNTTNESIHLLIHLFQFAHINSSKFTTNGTLNHSRQLVDVYVFYFFRCCWCRCWSWLYFFYYLYFSSSFSNFLFTSMQSNAMSCYVIPINHKYIETFPWWYQKSHTHTHTLIATSISFVYEHIMWREENICWTQSTYPSIHLRWRRKIVAKEEENTHRKSTNARSCVVWCVELKWFDKLAAAAV